MLCNCETWLGCITWPPPWAYTGVLLATTRNKQGYTMRDIRPTNQWSNMMQKYVFPSTYNFKLVLKLITFSHFCKSQINAYVKALKIESVPKLSSHWIGVPLQNAILLQSGFIYWTQQKSEAELKPVKTSHPNHLLDLWHRTFKFAFLAGYRFGFLTFFFAGGYKRPTNTLIYCLIIVY